MKIAYFDCFSGASGDMILGALVDAGLPPDRLRAELAKLPLSGYDIHIEPVRRSSIGASRVHVRISGAKPDIPARRLPDIEDLVEASTLTETAKTRIIGIFHRLAEAEAKVHRTDAANIHFHETGAVDAIVDVTGAVIGLEILGIDTVHASPIHLGTGMVCCAHGTIPVPAPATLELIRGIPVCGTGTQGELLTPTGAAILSSVCSSFGPLPPMVIETIGYGSGASNRNRPNLLRICIGRPTDDIVRASEDSRARKSVVPLRAVSSSGTDPLEGHRHHHIMKKGSSHHH